MIDLHSLLGFALVSLGMVLTPGPNMVYLISRSICQGRVAGIFSLAGVVLGFLFYMLAASLGLTVLLLAVPFAYDVLKFAGATYLLWLAWNAIKPICLTRRSRHSTYPCFRNLCIQAPVQ